MSGQGFAFKDSPSTVGIYLRISRGDASVYADLDMTEVTSVSAAVTFADRTTATWSLTPDASQTTETLLVAFKAFASGDTAVIGNATIIATPYVGDTALPPAAPVTMPIKLPALT